MIGIYGLLWEDDQIYIGQSINIKYRYKKHLSQAAAQEHHNYKVQNHYNKYGIPSLIILEECIESELDTKEIQWIKEFNATIDGLNITQGGNSGRGLFGTNSKYTKSQILKVFSLLYRTNNTYNSIENRTKVDTGVISAISNSTTHMWLEEKYPMQYEIIRGKQGNRLTYRPKGDNSYSKQYPSIVDPNGEVHNITNIAEFCRAHILLRESDRGIIAAVLRGDRKQAKGFRIFNGTNNTKYNLTVSLIDDLGNVYLDIKNITEFCKLHPILCTNKNAPGNLSKVTSGARNQSMGFRLYEIAT